MTGDEQHPDEHQPKAEPTNSTDSALPEADLPEPILPKPDLPTEVKASWLHPSSLIFEMLSHSRELFFPIAIALFSAAKGSVTGLFFGIAFFVPAVLFSVFRYFTLRYKIDRGELVVKKGLIFRNVRTVPVGRIQNIDLVQNPLHRIFRVAEVRIETASGTEPEATLRVLSMQKIAELRSLVFDNAQANAAARMAAGQPTTGDAETNPRPSLAHDQPGIPLLEIPTNWLLKAGLASNRGMLIIGVLAGIWFQFDLEEKIDFDQVENFLPVMDGSLFSVLAISGMVVAGLILMRLLGVFWFLLRFHGYRMTLHGEDVRITCGLITKVSATIPRKRIQFISVHRALIMRWFGLASIRIETAGGGGLSDNATTTISRRWFVPVISEERIAELVNVLKPGLQWNEQNLDWMPLAKGTRRRLTRLTVIPALLMCVFGYFMVENVFAGFGLWGILTGPALLPLFIWWARKKAKAMRYARDEEKLVYRSGIFTRITSMTFYDKVQTVTVAQSPFDRRWKMATLVVDTAASGPAEHRIRVRFLDDSFAESEHSAINKVASQFLPDFG